MPKIKNRDITDRFIEVFENGKPFTPSEKRMMGIKLAQLKKNIKAHIEATGRQTDLSVEQIIMNAIEYAVMTRKTFRSIASLGFEILDESLDYWEKRSKLEEVHKEKVSDSNGYNMQQVNYYDQNKEKTVDVVMDKSYNKSNNSPAWMNNNEW